GIRRYPYSIDLSKSPLLYGDINPNIGPRSYPAPRNPAIGNSANEVHNVGEIWCNTLLECRYQMSLTDGFAANQVIMQLAVDGMKMAPGSPSFLQERDAILQADLVRYAGAHQFALLTAFAKRGLGSGAQSPDSGANNVVENFDIPLRVDYSFPSGTPEQLSPTTSTSFLVHAAPFNVTITPGSGRLMYSINNGAFASTTLTPLGNDDYTATIPAAACFSNFRYYLSFDTSVGLRTSPTTAPAATYAAQVFTEVSVFASDDMEIDRGWTVSAGTPAATTGIWNRVAPSLISTASGLPIQPGADHTPAPGTRCWVTDGSAGGLGANDVDNGITILTSPSYNLAAANEPIFEYYRWYADNGNATADDTFLIQASTNNGATWQTAEAITASSNAWVRATWKLSDLGLSPTGQVKIRFSASDNTPAGNVGSVIEAAVDDLTITDRLCVSAPACDPDLNQDGNVDQGDIDYLINVVAGGANPTNINPDFNSDGNADQGDIDSLLNVVAGGACP
ncbi:MAG: M36 family metallopeptidase, partial [Phycisphaerales bacterium]